MKISIEKEGKSFGFRLPTRLLFLSFWLSFVNEKKGKPARNTLTSKQVRTLRMEIKKYRKKYSAWNFVEIESSDGKRIKIQI